MQIKELSPTQKKQYETFVKSHPLGSIHQTEEWGIFQSQAGRRDRHWIFVVENGKGEILASALVIRQLLPFKKCWLYCPRGPLIDFSNEESVTAGLQLFEKIKNLASEQDAIFFRFDPSAERSEAPTESKQENQKKVSTPLEFFKKSLHARPAHAHYQPEHTLIVDLQPTQEEILKQMKPKGRYNIKVAQKHNVKIRLSDNNPEDIDTFYNLLTQTTTRDKFSGHPLKYYQTMLQTLGSEKAKLYLAEYQDKIIAGAIVTYFNQTATYYFGASSSEFRNVMAPYLLHWQIMQDAKASGYRFYDFFGISPENDPKHAWASVTEFKLKFGGKRIEYISAQEIIYKPFWYLLMRLAKLFKKFI